MDRDEGKKTQMTYGELVSINHYLLYSFREIGSKKQNKTGASVKTIGVQ